MILVGVTYLFAIATNNGTVDWLVHAAIRAVGGRTAAIPWVMFLVTAILTASGAVVPPRSRSSRRSGWASPSPTGSTRLVGIVSLVAIALAFDVDGLRVDHRHPRRPDPAGRAVPRDGRGGAVGLIIALSIASSVVDSSPFSTSGALTVANTPSDRRDFVFKRLMQWGMSMGSRRLADRLAGVRGSRMAVVA